MVLYDILLNGNWKGKRRHEKNKSANTAQQRQSLVGMSTRTILYVLAATLCTVEQRCITIRY